jgi:hypothetical protein
MSLKSLSRWYPNFKPSSNRSAGDDDDLASLAKGRLLPFMEGGDGSQARKQMPVQSMCLNVVLSSDVGSAGNTVRWSPTTLPLFAIICIFFSLAFLLRRCAAACLLPLQQCRTAQGATA